MPEFLRWRIRLPPTVISSGTERRGRKSEMQNFSGRQCDSANLRFHTRTSCPFFLRPCEPKSQWKTCASRASQP